MEAEARPASTVVLLRDGPSGIETFMLRRASSMAFAADMHVFPGGRVDARDYEISVTFTREGEEERLAARASTDVAGVRALYACAVRETTEETGVVLAGTSADGELSIDSALIPIIDHWITPVTEPRRYDVRFFAAILPDGESATLETTEAVHGEWLPAAVAVERFENGEMAMLPPTVSMMRYVAAFEEASHAIEDASARAVAPRLPTIIVDANGRLDVTFPPDEQGRP